MAIGGMSESTQPLPADARQAQARAGGASAPTWLAGAALFVVVLSLQPFQAPPDITVTMAESSSSLVNQIGYLLLALVYLGVMLLYVPGEVRRQLVSPAWLAIFALAGISTLQSFDPSAAMRALVFTAVAMVPLAAALVLPRSEADFAEAATNATLAIVLLVYAVLLLKPELAVHSAEGVEGVHAGNWRGHVAHKNTAAALFSVLLMIGIYGWRRGLHRRGLLIVALSAFFILKTGSKTTLGFMPLSVGLVLLGRASRPGATVFLHAILTVAIAILTFGSAFSDGLQDLVEKTLGDATYTGRDEIWRFGLARIREHPWFGYGHVSFWQTPVVLAREENFEAKWDVRGIGSGHNAFLDAALMYGVPAGALISWLLLANPLRYYLAAARRPEKRDLADLFAMIAIFMTYNGMLESFFLNRADPLWLLCALPALALPLLARNPLRRSRLPDRAGASQMHG